MSMSMSIRRTVRYSGKRVWVTSWRTAGTHDPINGWSNGVYEQNVYPNFARVNVQSATGNERIAVKASTAKPIVHTT